MAREKVDREKQIANMMKIGMTREEALEVLADDEDIDKGVKKDFDLTAEQEKESKKARSTGTKKATVYDFKQRQRKENPTKRDLINRIYQLFKDAEITNPERIVMLTIGDDKFEITLSQKRKPKT